jgi:hypothetical protein
MPQTPKKSKDIYPASGPPVKINQRTGDAAPGQSKLLTRLANNRSASSVLRNSEIAAIKDLPNRAYYGEYGKDLRNIPRTEAYYEEINPFREVKLNSDTVYKDYVRNNQATDLLKPKTSKPSKPAQVQSKATPKPAPASPIETAAKTSVGAGMLASPAAKGVGLIGAMIASQKSAGLSPKAENSAVSDWNKRTNYGRLLGIKK